MVKDTRVVILAGGRGTRLKPYTTVIPKPLMPLGDMPILELVLRQVKFFGYRNVTISVNHLADLIKAFFGDGTKLGLDITYCIEDEPLGTAGSFSLIEDLTDHFLMINGDLLTTMNFADIMHHHIESRAIATIGTFKRQVSIDFGVLDLNENGELLDYREKPSYDYTISIGINAFNKTVLEFIPKSGYLDIPTLMMKLKSAGKRVIAFQPQCEWLDIGRPADYEEAIRTFEKDRDHYLRSHR